MHIVIVHQSGLVIRAHYTFSSHSKKRGIIYIYRTKEETWENKHVGIALFMIDSNQIFWSLQTYTKNKKHTFLWVDVACTKIAFDICLALWNAKMSNDMVSNEFVFYDFSRWNNIRRSLHSAILLVFQLILASYASCHNLNMNNLSKILPM